MTVDRLLQVLRTLRPLREGDAVGGVLRGVAAAADAQLQPSSGQVRDRGRDAGQDRWVAVHHVGHEGAQADAAGDHGRRREHRPALQQRVGQAAPAHEVVPDPGRGEAGRLQRGARTRATRSSETPMVVRFTPTGMAACSWLAGCPRR